MSVEIFDFKAFNFLKYWRPCLGMFISKQGHQAPADTSEMNTRLTRSPFSGGTGSRCSQAILTTLSSSGINNEHIPPCKEISDNIESD